LGEALRQTKRELKQMEKQNKEKEKESEERHKRDEIVTRTAERDREKAERERREKHKRQKAVNEMTAPGSGRPKSFAFEHQVRTVLASGCSARAAREQVLTSARVYLSPEVCTVYESMVPNTRWSTSPKPTPASSLVS
jgi:hypothetical protein